MRTNLPCDAASALLLDAVSPLTTERLPLSLCQHRVLGFDFYARHPIPPFDRSPYDGYAFLSADTEQASRERPVTLRILEEVPAGSVPKLEVVPGTATKVLTGAPIPKGADAVIMFEDTAFDKHTVTLFERRLPGSNIIKAGEDIKEGTLLCKKGSRMDPGLMGTLAALGEARPLVYKKPRVGILSTGSEVVEADSDLSLGQVRNSNRHSFENALWQAFCEPVYLGHAGDEVMAISRLIDQGLSTCDALVSTGGVSVGDYDLTPQAFARSGITPLFQGVQLKPGGACLYGVKDGVLCCGLSGNPASALTNFYVVALPAFLKLAGVWPPTPQKVRLTLAADYQKSSPSLRMLRGKLDLSDGTARFYLVGAQGNAVLSSMIGCDALALVPAGSGPLTKGTQLEGWLI